MGGAFVAVADDATGVYWNPAALAAGQPAGALLELHRFQNGDPGADPVGGVSKSSANLMSLGTWPIGASVAKFEQVRLIDAVTAERFSTTQYGLSLLQSLSRSLVLGATLKYVRGEVARGAVSGGTIEAALDGGDRLEASTDGAFDVDVSVIAMTSRVRLGATVRNLRRPEFRGEGGVSYRLPRHSRVGLAVLAADGLTLALDLDLDTVERTRGPQRMVAAGAEYRAATRVLVRAGARRNLEGANETVASAGASLSVQRGLWLDGYLALGSGETRAFGVGVRAGW